MSVVRALRGKLARVIGMLLGIALLVGGLLGPLSRLDLAKLATDFGWGGLGLAILLGCAANILGAMGWGVLVREVAPALPFWSSVRSFLLFLPMKYLPGSIWNQVSRIGWVAHRGGAAGNLTGAQAGGYLVAFDFGLLLWSGFVMTLLSGFLGLPAVADGRISPAGWWVVAAFAILLSSLIPAGLNALMGHRSGVHLRPPAVYAAQLLQMLGWLAAGALFYHLCHGLGAALVSISDAMSATWAGMTAGLAALFVPQGLGVREAVGALILSSAGVAELAFAAGVLARLAVMVSDLCCFGLAGVLGALSMRRQRP